SPYAVQQATVLTMGRVVAAYPPPGQDVGERWARPARKMSGDSASALAAGNLLDQVDDAPPELGIVDAHERLGERQAVGGREKIGHIGGRGRLAEAFRSRHTGNARRPVKEERHRHLKDVRNLLQPARADAICALFVLLHLLKGQAKSITELLLAHREHHATHPYAAT